MNIEQKQLKSIVERIERLHEERKAIADDIRDMYAEAKGNGYDVKVLKHVVKLRGQDLADREEFDAITDIYLQALGMLPDFEVDKDTRDSVTARACPQEPSLQVVS